MRHSASLWILLGILVPTLALGQPIAERYDRLTEDDSDPVPSESYVVLHTGEVIEGSVEVHARNGAPNQVVVNGTAYPLGQVRSYRSEGEVVGVLHAGNPKPMLLVRQTEGPASIYRHIDREGVSTDFFQVGSGPIVPASTKQLRVAFADHPGAMRHLNRDEFLSYAAIGAVVVGGGLIATGAVIEFADIDGPNGVKMGLMGVGFAALATAVIAPMRSQARRAAIRAYNQ